MALSVSFTGRARERGRERTREGGGGGGESKEEGECKRVRENACLWCEFACHLCVCGVYLHATLFSMCVWCVFATCKYLCFLSSFASIYVFFPPLVMVCIVRTLRHIRSGSQHAHAHLQLLQHTHMSTHRLSRAHTRKHCVRTRSDFGRTVRGRTVGALGLGFRV